jgi:hypothetical protein
MKNRNVNVVSEEVVVAYFNGLIEKYAALPCGLHFRCLNPPYLFLRKRNGKVSKSSSRRDLLANEDDC